MPTGVSVDLHGETKVECSVQDCRPNCGINLTIGRSPNSVTLYSLSDKDCITIIEGCVKVMVARAKEPKED